MGQDFLYISNSDVRRLLTFAKAIRIAEDTLLAHARGEVIWGVPRQLELRPEGRGATFKVKGCYLRHLNVVGLRIVGVNRALMGYETPADYFPTKFIMLSDADTGRCLALVDEHWSHAVRTGACVAVAARYLVRPGSVQIGLLGAGYMARTSLLALREVRQIAAVRVYARTPDSRTRFAREMGEQTGLRIIAVERPEDAVRTMDVVVAATTTTQPFVSSDWITPGCFFYSMGEHQEADDRAYTGVDKFVVDDWEQVLIKSDMRALTAAGTVTRAHLYAELGEIVSGQKPGREHAAERIFFRSQGLVTQDVAIAEWLTRQVRAGQLAGRGARK